MGLWSSLRTLGVSNPREIRLIAVAHGVNEFYSVALPPILPLIVSDFSISYGQAGALVTVFFIMYSVFQIPAGRLTDRFGQRWILGIGMFILAGGFLLATFAQNYRTLLVAEAVAGIGGSTYHPAGMSLISDIETDDTEGKAMGIHGIGGVVGTALAPVFIGGLATILDWRLALGLASSIGFVYGIVFLVVFRNVEKKTSGTELIDDGGRDPQKAADHSKDEGYLMHVASLTKVPFERWVGVLFIANFTIALEVSAVRTFIPSYFVEYASANTGTANVGLFILLVGAGFASMASGVLSDALDRKQLASSLMVLSAAILVATAFVPPDLTVLYVWMFLLGLVMYGAMPVMNSITSYFSEQEFSGSLFALMLSAASVGSAVGPLIFGSAAERFGMPIGFPLMGAVALVGAGAFLMLPELRRTAQNT
jgi:MFS family permease